jgi:hypothetical protein
MGDLSEGKRSFAAGVLSNLRYPKGEDNKEEELESSPLGNLGNLRSLLRRSYRSCHVN